jgi:drug/metabolite transporter (DMT)-like permease
MKRTTEGWSNGFLGVLIFSGTLPATRIALVYFSPLFITSARAVIAALLGACLLFVLHQTRPERREILPLALVAIGCIIGFPLLTALALQHNNAAHSTVFIGLLPLSTAIFGVIRGGERPKPAFWVFSMIGAAVVAGFALHGSSGGRLQGDFLMLGAVLICGLGYAEGATISRRLGGWQVISWSLLLAFPLMLVIAIVTLPHSFHGVSASAWVAFAYVSIFSMLVGFVFWYRGLVLGGIAGVGQLQLLQPFFGFLLAAIILGEPIEWTMIASAAIVVLCVGGAKRFS